MMYKTDEDTGKLIITAEKKEKKPLTEQDGLKAEVIIILLFAAAVIMIINLFENDTVLSKLMSIFGALKPFLFLIPVGIAIKIFSNTFKIDGSLPTDAPADTKQKNKDVGRRTIFEIPIGADLEDNKKKIFSYDFREGHTLIGGVTRYGKSVLLNTIIYNLIKINPKKLRLIIIDFKGVDFALFEDLPHLMTETIIGDKNRFKSVLEWLVNESDKRFELIRSIKARNIKNYNKRSTTKMSYIFVVLDEYLKMLSHFNSAEKKQMERYLNALVSTSAGCGIILFLTTQRPDVKLIDGSIKANLLNRIAFRCADEGNSEIILDQKGAELLTRKGEMLFKTDSEIKHLQGLRYSDTEILERVQDISCKYTAILDKIEFNYSSKETMEELKHQEPEQNETFFKNELAEKVVIKALADNKLTLSRVYVKNLLGVGDKKADEILDELKSMQFIDEDKKVLVLSN